MSINFPTSLDTFTNPTATDPRNNPSLAGQQSDQNDAIEALEAKVGVDSSAVNTSHDYKLGEVTSGDKAVGKTASQTLSNKTFITPTIASFENAIHDHSNNAGGGTIAESVIAFTDITTNNVSTSKHGYAPKLPNDATKFLDGTGNYTAPSSGATGVTFIPLPAYGITNFAASAIGANVNTTAAVGKVYIPAAITIAKITFRVLTHTTNGTIKIALFSEDGATKKFEVTSGTITAGSTNYTVTLGTATSISAGYYYWLIVPVSTTDTQIFSFKTGTTNVQTLNAVSGEPLIEGTITVTAGTVPSSITPTAISDVPDSIPVIRLDD